MPYGYWIYPSSVKEIQVIRVTVANLNTMTHP